MKKNNYTLSWYKVFSLFFILAVGVISAFGQTAATTGDWTTSGTWSGGTPATTGTTASPVAVTVNTAVTLTVSTTITGVYNITVNGSGVLNITGTGVLNATNVTVAGTGVLATSAKLTMATGGVLNVTGNVTVNAGATSTWVPPSASVTGVRVQAWSGGGGGGGSSSSSALYSGGGGAGGNYILGTATVASGTVYSVVAGAGGTGGTTTSISTYGGSGGPSFFGPNATFLSSLVGISGGTPGWGGTAAEKIGVGGKNNGSIYAFTQPSGTNGVGYSVAPSVIIGNQWAASTSYSVGTQVAYKANLYTVTTAGTSTSTPPTNTSGASSGTGAVFTYAGAAAFAYSALTGSAIQYVAFNHTNGTTTTSVTTIANGSGYTSAPAITFGYPAWAANTYYYAGSAISYGGYVYTVGIAGTSNTTPPANTSGSSTGTGVTFVYAGVLATLNTAITTPATATAFVNPITITGATSSFLGGNGGNGTYSSGSTSNASGGGGGSAGTASNGNAGATATANPSGGATAITGGGSGGNGSNVSSTTAGNAGAAPTSGIGGGGGGATGITKAGGAGAAGQVVLSYTSITLTGTLSDVNTTYGTVSASPTNFVIASVNNLFSNITVTPPAGFEVSTTSNFASVGTNASPLSISSGSSFPVTVYVRLAATTAAGSYSGNITLASTGYSTTIATASSTVAKATPTLSVGNSPQITTGSAISATVNASIAGTVSNIRYNGSATVPSAVNSYPITADFTPTDAANYNSLTGASAGTFVITPVQYSVTYAANGGSGNVPTDASVYSSTNGLTVTVLGNEGTPTTLSRAGGYVFAGWTPNGGATVYQAGNTFTIGANTTLTAVWTITTYTTTTTGDWNSPSTWVQGEVPAAGVPVSILHAITVNSNQTGVAVSDVTIGTSGSIIFGASGNLSANSLTVNSDAANPALVMTSGGTLSLTTSLSNAGTINAGGSISIGTSLANSGTLSGGSCSVSVGTNFSNTGTFTGGTSNVTVAGALTSSGTFTAGSGTVTFTGNNTLPALTFNNLTINGGTSTVSAANAVIVNGALTTGASGTLSFASSSTLSTATISDAGTINMTNGGNLTITGSSFTVSGTGTFTGGTGTLTTTGSVTLPLITNYSVTPNLNITYNNITATAGTLTLQAPQYNASNVLIAQPVTASLGMTVNGDFNVTGTASLMLQAQSTSPFNFNGDFIVSTSGTIGTTTMNGGGGTCILNLKAVSKTFTANVTSAVTSNNTWGKILIAITGNYTLGASSALINSGGTNRVLSIDGTGTLTIPSGRTLDLNTHLLYIPSTSTATTPLVLSGTLKTSVPTTVATANTSTLSPSFATATQWPTDGSTLNAGDLYFNGASIYQITTSGTSGNVAPTTSYASVPSPVSVSGGTALYIGYSSIYITLTGATPIPGSLTYGGTVQYGLATGAQTVIPATYNNLTLSNTSNTNTAGGNVVVNGTLTTTSGGTFALSTNTLSGTLSSVANAGTISTTNTTSSTPLTAGVSWGTTGTVNYAATGGGQTVVAGNYNNLTISASSGATTLSGNIGVANTFTPGTGSATYSTNGSTVNFNAAGAQSIPAFNYNNLTLSSGGAATLAAGTIGIAGTFTPSAASYNTNGGTVSFNGGSQNIPAFTFNNLTIANSGSILTGAVSVANVMTLTSGIVTTTSSNLLSITRSLDNSGITGGSASSFINGPMAWTLQNPSTANAYIFPVGNGSSYNPITLTAPSTSAVGTIATVQFGTSNSGSFDNSTLKGLSNSSLWTVSASGGNITNARVSVTSGASLGVYNLIGRSTTPSGSYSSLGGTVSGNSINTSNTITAINSGSSAYYGLGFLNASVAGISSFTASAVSTSQINLTTTSTTNGFVIVFNETGSFTTPSGVAPSSGLFANGTVLQKSAAGSSIVFNHTGRTSNTTYYYAAFAFDGSNNYSSSFPINQTTLLSVSTPTVGSITNSGVTVSGDVTASGSAAISAIGVSYGTSAAPTNSNASGLTDANAFSSQDLTGLSAQTLYYANLYATNAGGTTRSSDVSFRTLSASPTTQASGLYATEASTTSMSVTLYTAAVFPSSGATKTGYLLAYSTGSTPTLVASPDGLAPAAALATGTLVNVTEANAPTAPVITAASITGLTTGSTYYVTVIPYTWDGTNAATYNYLTASAPTSIVTLYSDFTTWSFATNGATTDVGNVTGTTIVGSPTYTNIGGTASTGFAYATIGGNGLTVSASANPASSATWLSEGSSSTYTVGDGTTKFSTIAGGNYSSDNRYVQFDIKPKSGFDFTVNRISVPVKSVGGSNTYNFMVAYSTNGFATTPTYFSTFLYNGSTITPSGAGGTAGIQLSPSASPYPNGLVAVSTPSGLTIRNGQTLSVRVIAWIQNATSKTNTVFISNVQAFGTTTAAPTLTTSTSSLSGFTYTENAGGPSTAQSFTMSTPNASLFSGNSVTVTAPTNYEVCTTQGGTYTASLSVPAASINSTTIYTKLKASLTNDNSPYTGNITFSSASASFVGPLVALSGTVSASPTVYVNSSLSDATLSGFSYIFGNGASQTPSSFIVSGNNLTSTITVSAPTNYQISTSAGSGYGSSLTLSGANTTVYVRLKTTLALGTYNNETITVSATGSNSITITLNGDVTSLDNPASFTATSPTTTDITLAATGNGTDNIVVLSNTTGVFTTPSGLPNSLAGFVYSGSAASLPSTFTSTSNKKTFFIAYSYDGSVYSAGITANATTLPVVSVATASSITTSSATLGATITTGGGATITGAGVLVSTSANPSSGTNAGTVSGSSISLSANSLSAQTLYYAKSYATNAGGTTYASGDVQFYTLSSAPTAQATYGVNQVATGSMQVVIRTPATYPGSGASKTGYVLAYATSALSTASFVNGTAPSALGLSQINTSALTLDGTAPTAPLFTGSTVTGLTTGATYNVILVPYTWDGTNSSTINYFTTNAPTATITMRSDVVSWTFASNGNAATTGNVTGSSINPTNYTNIGGTTTTGFAYATINSVAPNVGLNLCASGSSAVGKLWVVDGVSPTAATASDNTVNGAKGYFNGVSTAASDARYVQFDVAPTAGSSLTVNNISIPIYNYGSSTSLLYAVAYSLNGFTNSSYTYIAGSATTGVSLPAASSPLAVAGSIASYATNIIVGSGQTLSVRVIAYVNSSTISAKADNIVISNVSIAGTSVATPLIAVTPSALTGLNYVYGSGPSTAKSISVTGTNLTGNVTVSSASATNYEISSSSATTGFVSGSTLTITQSAGNATGTIWVRLKAGYTPNTYSQSLTLSSAGATTQTVSLDGTVGQLNISIASESKTNAKVGQAYTFTPNTSGGSQPSAYTASTNTTPTLAQLGLAINTTTGVITGTPTQAGTFTIGITGSAANANSGTGTLTLTIAAPTYYYYSGTGALNTEASWLASNGTSASSIPAVSGIFSTIGNTYEINNSVTTSGGSWSPSGTIVLGNATKAGVTLTVASGSAVNGTLNIAAASTGSNTIVLQDATIPTFGTIGTGSTVNYSASVAQNVRSTTYSNLILSNTQATSGANVSGAVLATGTVNINGVSTFASGAYIGGASATLSINSGASLYIADVAGIANSTTSGSIRTAIANRTFSPGASYTFTGAAAQATGGGFLSCKDLTINPSTGVTVTISNTQASDNNLSVTGILSLNAGTLATGGNLTLKSTSIANTAMVGAVCPTCIILGSTNVERYIPAGFRAYRDIAPELYTNGPTNGNIFKNWQENGAMTSGYGIFITGPSAVRASDASFYGASSTSPQPAPDATSGLDFSINGNASAYTYTNGAASPFTAITNTTNNSVNTPKLDVFAGYRVLIRGDRSFNLANTPILNYYNAGLRMANATTLRTKLGFLVYGDVLYSSTANATGTANGASISSSGARLNTATNGFSMIANPYVSTVSWSSVYAASSNINGSFWYLDPTSSDNGKYIAYNALTGSTTVNGTSGNYSNTGTVPVGTDYIQPGQAFFVQNASSGSPSVKFTEASKVTSVANLKAIFGVNKPLSKIYLSLLKEDSATVYARKDGAAIAFANGFTNTTYGPQDALKFGSANDNLYITDKGKNLSIDGRLPATATDVLPIALNKMTGKKYQLVIDATTYDATGYIPVLKDNYKGTVKELALDVNTISFTVDTTIAASYANRFSLGFKVTTLAVNSIVASATLNNKIATINWNTVGEKSMSRFEVEKSTDAKTFTKIGQFSAKNTATATYSTSDNSVTATTFYRIKAISEVGTVTYSNVAKVSADNRLPSYSLYPNPLKGSRVVNVSLTTVAAGKYTVTINNVLGQRVQEVAISHAGGNGSHAITVNSTMAKGTYSVTIRETASGTIVHQSNLSVN